MIEQRLPAIDGDEGHWGEILNQFLAKEHYNTGLDNATNGGHKTVTIQPGTTAAGTAPLKFTSGTLLTTPEAGAIEFNSDTLYFTQTTSTTRKKIAAYDDTSGATGDIYYRNSSGYFTRLGIGGSGNVLTVSGGIPSWAATSTLGSSTPTASTLAAWDANKNLSANSFLQGFTTTATAGGTTTLTVASTQIQAFTGTLAQTVVLPSTSIVAGAQYRIVNNSTGAVTVQSSGLNTIVVLSGNTSGLFTALVATPTTAANWDGQYFGSIVANGKSLTVNNSLTFAGTDSTTMTFPGASDTVVTLAAAQTLTNKTISGASNTLTNIANASLTNSSITINGSAVSLGGSTTVTANTTNALTFNNGGAGAASGTTFNGSAAQTISYNTIGASPLAGSASLTTTGTVTSGTWSGSFGAVSGANLTNLTAGNLTGTIPSAVLGNSTHFIGTTSVALNRASANLALTGISSVQLPGATSGTITLQPVNVAGTTTINLPATSGTLITTGDTGTVTNTMLAGSILLSKLDATAYSSTSTASTLAQRDANKNITANTFIPGFRTQATAGTTTTLTIADAQTQEFTGTLTQTVTLPTTSIVAGAQYTIVNNSTGVLTVQSSGANTISTIASGRTATFTAVVATPTTAANWDSDYITAGDASTNTATSVVDEVVLFADTTGKVLKRATTTGIAKLTSGVISAAVAGTDYALPSQTMFIGTTSVAINRTSANLALTGISSVTLPGATSGTVLLQPAATAGTTTITLPATTGTVITTGDTGTVTNTMLAGSIADTKLATISTAGKVSNSATTATNANTASAIVARDASGNFSAGTITATLSGSATTATTATNLANGSAGTLPYQSGAGTTAMLAAGTSGQVLKSAGASAPSWSTLQMTDIPDAAFKKSVKAATTADLGTVTYANGTAGVGATITGPTGVSAVVFPAQDGITIALNDRILVKNQATPAQNGIYTLTTVGVAGTTAWVLTRATDADTNSEIGAGVVAIDQGTANAGELWTTNFKATDVIGTTAMVWYEVIYNSGTWAINTTGSAATLTTPRTVQTNLASASSVSFDGSANITPGVTGTLPVSNGGTGVSTITGLVKGNGASAMSAAAAGTDYALPNQTMFIGTTSVATNRASASLALTGITSIDGSAATLTTARTINGTSFNGSANITTASWGTSRTLAGNTVNGSVNVAFSNKFIVQGTADAGLSGAQFLGALGTGLVKNTTTTGVLSIAAAGTDYVTPTGTETLSNKTLTAPKIVSGGFIADANGNEQIIFTTTTSAVNEITITNAATGNKPTIAATGTDTNVTLNLTSKGSGTVQANGNPILTSVTAVSAVTGTPSASTYLRGDGTWATVSSGDASTNTATSVDSEVALFSGTGGKTLKRATGSGIAKLTSGVLSAVTAPTGTIVGTTDTQTLTNKTISGASNTLSNIAIGSISATGTPSSSTFLRGDGTWSPGGITRFISVVSTNTTLGSSANTDYVTFSNIAAPTPTNGSSRLTFNNTLSDAGTNPLTWTLGSASYSSGVVKYGSHSINTTSGGISGSTATAPGTGDFTVEFWAYPTSTSSRCGLFDTNTSKIRLEYITSGVVSYRDLATGLISSSTNALTLNGWNHIAICRSGTSTRLFINGTQAGSTYTDTTNYTPSTFYIGILNGGLPFPGYIDDFRYSRYAFYTSSFTPPGSELPTTAPTPPTLTLPTAVSNENLYIVKNINATSVTIATTSSQTIDGASTISLNTNEIRHIISDSSNWRTIVL